jgi:hypothetical protein
MNGLPDWLLDEVKETRASTTSAHFVYLGALVYCALTLLGVSDRQIVLNNFIMLPIVGVSVSFLGFCIFGPLILICLFVYAQMYSSRLKYLSTSVPGAQSVYVYSYVSFPPLIGRHDGQGLVHWVEQVVSGLLTWWSLPVLLMFSCIISIKRHDPHWVTVLGLLPLIGTIIVLAFWIHITSDAGLASIRFPNIVSEFRSSLAKCLLLLLVIGFEVYLFVWHIPQAMAGKSGQNCRTCINLSHQNLSTKPVDDYPSVYWVDLEWAHLEGAFLAGTVLKRADLHKACLNNAYLFDSVLEGANLWRADLQGADLHNSDFKAAILNQTNLQGADLSNVQNLDPKALINAFSLFQAKIDEPLRSEMQKLARWPVVSGPPPARFKRCASDE